MDWDKAAEWGGGPREAERRLQSGSGESAESGARSSMRTWEEERQR